MSSITEEQKRRAEANRLKALDKLHARRSAENRGPSPNANLSNPSKNPPTGRPSHLTLPQSSNPSRSLTSSSSNQFYSGSAPGTSRQTNFAERQGAQTYQRTSVKTLGPFSSSSPSSQNGKKNSRTPSSSPPKFYGKTTVVTFRLLSKDWFEADVNYMKQIIDIFKTIAGYKYDCVSKKWSFPIGQHSHLANALRPLRPDVIVAELPKIVFTLLNLGKINVPEETVMTRVEPALASTLLDFQRDGVRYAVSREGRVLIADDMGLGKTIQAIAIASFYKNDWPLLIVCPSSMRFQWKEEICTHMPAVPLHHIYVMTSTKDCMDISTRVLITSYDLMVNQSTDLLKKQFGVVILDESHHLKNPKTARTKVASEIVQYSRRCVLLTGTPVLSRPQELYCQLRAIRPKIFTHFMDFGIRYCDGKKEKFGWNFNGSSNMQELSVVLQEALMIRRLKSDVLAQLPPKRREVVIIDIGKNTLGNISEFGEKLEKEGLKGIEKKACLLEYFSETGRAKTSSICQFVLDTIENDEKFLVFAHHTAVLNAVCQAVESKKKKYIRIDGTTSSENRKLQCVKFQNDSDYVVAILSIRAASTGITLTAANLVVFAELFWNPGDLIQAEDRVHRIGQQDSVLIKYLIARGTADDHIWPMIRSKLDVLNRVGLSKDTFESAETLQTKVEPKPQKDILSYFGSSQTSELEGIDWAEFEDPM